MTDDRAKLIHRVWWEKGHLWRPEYGDVFRAALPTPQPWTQGPEVVADIPCLTFTRRRGRIDGAPFWFIECEGLEVDRAPMARHPASKPA